MILLDSTYVHTGGGKVLLNYFLGKIPITKQKDIYLLLDSRINLKNKSTFKHKVINPSELERRIFYKKNNHKFSKYFCFSNVPPPIKTNKETFIFFQNELILSTRNSEFGYIKKLNFWIKKSYIKLLNRNYLWIVQTKHMMGKLSREFNIEKKDIFIYPFFQAEHEFKKKQKTSLNIFIYPTSLDKHKNNDRLIKAFIKVADSINEEIILKITLNQNDLAATGRNIPKNLKVEFLGKVSFDELKKHYNKSKFLIFPSLKESFGLPLIEATQMGLYVLGSDLEYTYELIGASKYFNPLSISSIENCINESISENNLKLPKINVQNSIENILKKIIYV